MQERENPKYLCNRRARKEFFRLAVNGGAGLTEARKKVVEFFFSTEKHFTAKDLFEEISRESNEVTMQDVTATLDLLLDFGFARKRVFENKSDAPMYEHQHLTEHHDHLICLKCDKIFEFLDPKLESLQNKIAESQGFLALNHGLEIYGICKECQGLRAPLMPVMMAAQGERVVIRDIKGCENLTQRLNDMGMTPGTTVEVITNGSRMILSVRGSRVAIGRGMSSKIMVEQEKNNNN